MATREDELDVNTLDKPVPEYVEEDDGAFEILSEEDERAAEFLKTDEPKEPTELEKQLAEAQARLEELTQKADAGKQVASGFENLGSMLQKMNEKKTEPTAAPQIDWEAKQKELKDKFYDDPVAAMVEFNQLFNAPAYNNLQQELAKTKRQLAKQEIMGNERNKMIYTSYGSEVEEYVQAFDNDPDAYKKALAMVGMNHFDELLEKQMSERSEKETAKAGKTPGFNAYTETPAPPQRKPKGIVLKAHEKREFDRAFTLSPFNDQKYFYENIWLPSRAK